MVTQQQLRQGLQRIKSPTSETILRQQDIVSRVRRRIAPGRTQEQIEAEVKSQIIQENVSTLQGEKEIVQKELAVLTKTKDDLIRRLDKEGTLDSQTVRGINADYNDRRKDVVSKIQGLTSAITEAKTGAFTLTSLRTFAAEVEGAKEQQASLQIASQKEIAARSKEKITVTKIAATQVSPRIEKTTTPIRDSGDLIPTTDIQKDLQKSYDVRGKPFVLPKKDAVKDTVIVKGSEIGQPTGTFEMAKTPEPTFIGKVIQAPSKVLTVVSEKAFGVPGQDKTIIQKALFEVKKFVTEPVIEGTTVIGGKLIPTKEFEKLTPEQQKLLFFAQPETILASTVFPRVVVQKPIGVKFSGVSSQTDEGLTTTTVGFKTTTGQRGGAIGVSKQISSADDVALLKTDIVGATGRRVVEITKTTPKVVLKDITKFAGRETSVVLKSGDKFVQIGAGGIAQADDVIAFRSVGIGGVDDATTNLFGVTQTDDAIIISGGQIKDVSKLKDTGGVNFIKTGTGTGTGAGAGFGKGGTILTQKSAQAIQEAQAQAATEAAVRAAVNVPKDVITTVKVISPAAVTTGGLIVSKTDTKQVPSMIDMGSKVDRVTDTTGTFTGFTISETQRVPDTKFVRLGASDIAAETIIQEPRLVLSQDQEVETQVKLFQAPSQITTTLTETTSVQVLAQQAATAQQQKILQIQATAQTATQKQAQITKPAQVTRAAPLITTPIGLGKAVTQVKEKVKAGGIFEAVGIRFGQEVSLLKGTKKEATKKLSKFLTTTLGASGFLKTGEKKLKAEETGLLKQAGFRKSKVDPFKVVEKKERRLKKRGQEVKEISVFKKKSGKKSKSLFGI